MPVVVSKSICNDCIWKNSCQKLAKINGMDDRRNNPGYTNDKFEVLILDCSLKNYDRSYGNSKKKLNINKNRENKNKYVLYYCPECKIMHHSTSQIGRHHNRNNLA